MPPRPASPQVSFEARQIQLSGGRVDVHVGGQGRPLVLLHSLLADRTSFDRVLQPLASVHRVMAFDLPGFAGSDYVDGGLEAVADRVTEAVRVLTAGGPLPIVLGNGYGGFVALTLAIRHPHLVNRLVLADCGAAFSEPGRAAFRGMSAAADMGGLAAVADVAMRRLFAPDYQAEHPELIAERRERFLAIQPRTFHSACAALATLDLRPRLAAVKLPVLVLVGAMDEATPPPMARELAAGLPDARLIELPGCAHVPQLQEPEVFVGRIAAFLAG